MKKAVNAALAMLTVIGLASGCLGVLGPKAKVSPYAGGVLILWSETQSGTAAQPDAGSSQSKGFSLANAAAFHAGAQCSDLSNITAGSLVAFNDSPLLSWMPAPTYANCTLPTGGPTGLCADLIVSTPAANGRFYYTTSGVTCSGGSWDGGVLVWAETLNQ